VVSFFNQDLINVGIAFRLAILSVTKTWCR